MTQAAQLTQRFTAAFAETYRLLHRRNRPDAPQLTPQGRALLLHLEWSGPLAIGDLAKHSERAQSVVSETVEVLRSHGLLESVRDPRDKRRTLVWLTQAAQDYLTEERQPLDRQKLETILDSLSEQQGADLIAHYEAFIERARHIISTNHED